MQVGVAITEDINRVAEIVNEPKSRVEHGLRAQGHCLDCKAHGKLSRAFVARRLRIAVGRKYVGAVRFSMTPRVIAARWFLVGSIANRIIKHSRGGNQEIVLGQGKATDFAAAFVDVQLVFNQVLVLQYERFCSNSIPINLRLMVGEIRWSSRLPFFLNEDLLLLREIPQCNSPAENIQNGKIKKLSNLGLHKM